MTFFVSYLEQNNLFFIEQLILANILKVCFNAFSKNNKISWFSPYHTYIHKINDISL